MKRADKTSIKYNGQELNQVPIGKMVTISATFDDYFPTVKVRKTSLRQRIEVWIFGHQFLVGYYLGLVIGIMLAIVLIILGVGNG